MQKVLAVLGVVVFFFRHDCSPQAQGQPPTILEKNLLSARKVEMATLLYYAERNGRHNMTHYTYKFRLYPTKEQQARLASHFGCCRFVYNHFLEQRKDAYLKEGKTPNYYQQAAELTKLKSEKEWMYETNSQVLQFELKCLQTAYNNFFEKRAKLPKFHSRKDRQSFTAGKTVKVSPFRSL